jgi:hypothetical protein
MLSASLPIPHKYSINELSSLRHYCRISRAGRRTLFRLHLWKPSSPSPTSSHYSPPPLPPFHLHINSSGAFNCASAHYSHQSSIILTCVRVIKAAKILIITALNLSTIILKALCVCLYAIVLVQYSCLLGLHKRKHPRRLSIAATEPTPTCLPVSYSSTPKLVCALMNCRSLCNKSAIVCSFLHEHKIDLLFVTESWLNGNSITDNQVLFSSCPADFSFISIPRTNRKGGGIVLFYKNCLSIKLLNDFHSSCAYESACFELKLGSLSTLLIALYRPPNASHSQFENDFSQLISSLLSRENYIVCGDFNLNVSLPSPSSPACDASHDDLFFHSLNLRQHVNDATHLKGKILDLILTQFDSSLVESVHVVDGVSDHSAVLFSLACPLNPTTAPTHISKKLYHQIDESAFLHGVSSLVTPQVCTSVSDLMLSVGSSDPPLCSPAILDPIFSHYCNSIKLLLDDCTPTLRLLKRQSAVPWWSSHLNNLKLSVRRAERKWRSTRLLVFCDIYRHRKVQYHAAINHAKSKFIQRSVRKHQDSPKATWRELNRCVGRVKMQVLPICDSDDDLACQFNEFFVQKVLQVRQSLSSSSLPSDNINCQPIQVLSQWNLLTERSVVKLIRASPTKSDLFDPIPTWVLKKYLKSFSPLLTVLINSALTFGMPPLFKHSVIRPLLKKPSLDSSQLSNYRPISSLHYLSKVIERAVSNQLTAHLNNISGFDIHQSAYRAHHSCETALTYLLNSVFLACDSRKVTVLVMLDLTAAFDTVDHSILCHKLASLGVSGDALAWISSYLSQRSQSVQIRSSLSSPKPVVCGVPQGSVLGPLLFVIYMYGISRIFAKYSISYVLYADDIQLWKSCCVSELPATIAVIEQCISDIHGWLSAHKLCLNLGKSEVILLGSRPLVKKCHPPAIRIGNITINSKSTVRDLGVILDENLTFEQHISHVSSASFLHLKVISKVRKSLPMSQCMSLIHSLVISRILYCGSIYYKITAQQLLRLQRILNAAIRVGSGRLKTAHIGDLVLKYNWLPIEGLIFLRMSLFIFSVIRSGQPRYLSSEVHFCASLGLRSTSDQSLKVRRSSSELGTRAFAVYVSTIWNTIPADIRQSAVLNLFWSRTYYNERYALRTSSVSTFFPRTIKVVTYI